MRNLIVYFAMAALAASGMIAQPNRVIAQPKKDPKDLYEFRQVHDANGTGKFYMNREIAYVMGWQGAGWLERPEREREEKVSMLMPELTGKPKFVALGSAAAWQQILQLPRLGIQRGDVVADFGAGSGFHTVRLSKLVGPKGKVYAVDVQPQMIMMLQKRLKNEKINNVTPVLNNEKEAKLPASGVDLILMVDVYHELSFPYEVGIELVKALKPGGRLVFVEFRLEDKNVPILDVHRMSQAQVKKEMAEHKELRHAVTHNHLPWQHVLIFEKVADKK